jgi:hypothetical protein
MHHKLDALHIVQFEIEVTRPFSLGSAIEIQAEDLHCCRQHIEDVDGELSLSCWL